MKTFFMIKPDGVQRNLVGEIISRVEAKGFSITKIKMMTISKELAEQHYGEHKDKPFFNDLVSFITSGPVVAMQVEGENVVLQIRNLMGATNPSESTPGSIRGDLATVMENPLASTLETISPTKFLCTPSGFIIKNVFM